MSKTACINRILIPLILWIYTSTQEAMSELKYSISNEYITTKRNLLQTGSGWIVGSPPNMTYKTSGSAVGYDNTTNSVIIVGGLHDSTQKVQSYNLDNDEFTELDNIPRRCIFNAQGYTQKGNILYMLDQQPVLSGPSISINTYALNTKEFIFEYQNITIPYDAFLSCLSHIITNDTGDYLIISGGVYSPKIVQIYSFSEDKWLNNVPSMKSIRTQHSCIVFGDYFYVFGGSDKSSTYLKSVEKLYIGDLQNINDANWMYINDSLSVRHIMSRAVIYDNLIYIIGGCTQEKAALQNVDVLDPETDKITVFNNLAYAVGETMAITVDHKIFVFGGRHSRLATTDTWQYYDFCDLSNGYYKSLYDIPCECIQQVSICTEINKCYFDNIYDNKCKLIDDEYCNNFEHNIFKPCPCFNNDKETCILFDSCMWDQSVCKSNGYCQTETDTPTIYPTLNPTTYPTQKTYNPTIYPTYNPTFKPTQQPINPKPKGKPKGKPKKK
eukprot:30987_1